MADAIAAARPSLAGYVGPVDVSFVNVGSRNLAWTDRLPRLDHSSLLGSVRKHNALGSRGVDFDLDESTGDGTVYVGGFRAVGTFIVERAHA